MRTALVLTALALVLAVPGASARANHQTSPPLHIGSVHSGFNNEGLCVDPSGSTLSWTTALSNIEKALWLEARPIGESWDSKSWDPVASNWRIYFFELGGGNCDLLDATQRSAVDIEYWLWDNTGGGGCINPSSCVNNWTGPYDDGRGHTEYSKVRVNLYAPYTVGTAGPANYYRHQVNHETGHVLGLADGSCSPVGSNSPDSVMHTTAYGCGQDRPWPTSTESLTSDVATEIWIAEH